MRHLRTRQFILLADGHESFAESVRNEWSEEEPTTLKPSYRIELHVSQLSDEPSSQLLHRLGILNEGADITEIDI